VTYSDGSNLGTNCFTCQNRKSTEWCILSDEELELLSRGRTTRDYIAGESIFSEGEDCKGVYCIESGLIGVRKYDANGNSVLLYLCSPGETLGYRALLAGENLRTSAEVLEPSRVCFINSSTVRSLLNQNPALGLRYLKKMSTSLGEAEENILHNVTLSVRARFAHLLTVLLDKYAAKDRIEPIRFELPTTRSNIAAMIGTSPETVSRTIHDMETEGIVKFSKKTVTVPILEKLIEEFEPDQYV